MQVAVCDLHDGLDQGKLRFIHRICNVFVRRVLNWLQASKYALIIDGICKANQSAPTQVLQCRRTLQANSARRAVAPMSCTPRHTFYWALYVERSIVRIDSYSVFVLVCVALCCAAR